MRWNSNNPAHVAWVQICFQMRLAERRSGWLLQKHRSQYSSWISGQQAAAQSEGVREVMVLKEFSYDAGHVLVAELNVLTDEIRVTYNYVPSLPDKTSIEIEPTAKAVREFVETHIIP